MVVDARHALGGDRPRRSHLTLFLKRMRALQHLPRVSPALPEVITARGYFSALHGRARGSRSFTSASTVAQVHQVIVSICLE